MCVWAVFIDTFASGINPFSLVEISGNIMRQEK